MTKISFIQLYHKLRKYLHEGIFVFEQQFPFGVKNAQLPGENPASHISTGFPVFNVPKTDTGLGFITPGGNMMGNTKLSYGPFYDLQVSKLLILNSHAVGRHS